MSEPILRWAGSKKKLLPVLCAAAPARFERYVEPFVGSAVYFLRLNASKAILGDINADLIETYKTVRAHPLAVWNRASIMSTDDEFYYELRSTAPERLGELDRAARFVYLNRFCFNGVYRTNRQGQFNVARGKGHLFIPDFDSFKKFSGRLANASLHNCDFETIVSETKVGDFLYLDPPYARQGQRDRGEYGVGAFKEIDEDRLADALLETNKRGVRVLLSYSPSPNLIQKLDNWQVHNLKVTRNVAGFARSRRTADEVLISNYKWPYSRSM